MSEEANAAIARVEALAVERGFAEVLVFDPLIVRGLAYYTGTVFELVAEGERAVAGGGRYDGLVELMGGPSTPAVGFAMGDVVLGLLLEEQGLMPGDGELAAAVDAVRRSYSLRPEVFVVGNGDDGSAGGEDCEGMVVPLVSALRRGVEVEGWGSGEWDRPWEPRRYAWGEGGVRPLHVRVTSKSTRNMKKLKGEADRVGARLFCEIHGSEKVELTDLDRGEALTPGVIAGMPGGSASFSVDPSSAGYVGRAAVRVLGGGAFGEGGGS